MNRYPSIKLVFSILFTFFFVCVFSSCDSSKTTDSTSTSDTTNLPDSSKESPSVAAVIPNLSVDFDKMDRISSLSGFRKFVFKPYYKKNTYHLAIYGLNDRGEVIGRGFAVPDDPNFETANTNNYQHLSLHLRCILTILGQTPNIRNFELHPEELDYQGVRYTNFKISIDGTQTEFYLNPSPPGMVEWEECYNGRDVQEEQQEQQQQQQQKQK